MAEEPEPEERGILQGGPFHSRVIHVIARDRIAIPYAPPADPMVVLPPRRWWHRLLRRPVPIPPDPPQFRNLIYRKTTERSRNGDLVYRYEEPEDAA